MADTQLVSYNKKAARLKAISDEQAVKQKALDDEKANLIASLKAEQERKNRKLFEAKTKEKARRKAEKDAKMEESKKQLIAWADSITTDPGPDVKDPIAQKIVETYVEKLVNLAYCLRLDAEEL